MKDDTKHTLQQTAQRISGCKASHPSALPAFFKQIHCIKLPSPIVNKLLQGRRSKSKNRDWTNAPISFLTHADTEAKRCLESQNFPVEAIRINQKTQENRPHSHVMRWRLHNPQLVVKRLSALVFERAQTQSLQRYVIHPLNEENELKTPLLPAWEMKHPHSSI